MPRHGLGRGFKVSKEQIVALLTALRLFASGAYDPVVAGYRLRLERLAASLLGARATVEDRGDGESFPVLVIAVDAAGRSATEVCRRLRAGNPPIYVGHGRLAEGKLVIHPLHLDDAKVDVLGRRLREELG
jgi:L-seryl-tRNA(Ser) seleniumtransferase